MQKLQEFIAAGSSFRIVDARGNWYSRSAAGVETYTLNTGNWNWDSTVPSRPAVVPLLGDHLPRHAVVALGDMGLRSTLGRHEKTWGTTATPGEVAQVRGIVADWKPAGTRCVNIIIAFDPASFDPTAPEPDGVGQTLEGSRRRARRDETRNRDYWDGTTT